MTDTQLPADLIKAFRETHYKVLEVTGLTLRIDEISPDLAQLHQKKGVTCSTFITACNPFSVALSNEQNLERQAALAQELKLRRLSFLQGLGQHPDNGWQGEPSYLVFGLAREEAKALGQRWEQNAIVWADADAVPRLLLLR